MHGTLKISSVMEELENGVFFTQNTFMQENLEVKSFDFFRDLFFCELCHVQRIHQLVKSRYPTSALRNSPYKCYQCLKRAIFVIACGLSFCFNMLLEYVVWQLM